MNQPQSIPRSNCTTSERIDDSVSNSTLALPKEKLPEIADVFKKFEELMSPSSPKSKDQSFILLELNPLYALCP